MATEQAPPETAIECIASGRRVPAPQAIVWAVASMALLLSVFHLFAAGFSPVEPYQQRTFCLTAIMVLGFLIFPLGRKSWREKPTPWFALDVLCIVLSIAVAVYVVVDYENFQWRGGHASTVDVIAGTIILVLLLELTRRAMGWTLVIMAVFFICTMVFAEQLPGVFRGPGVPWDEAIEILWMRPVGIMGLTMSVVTRYLVIFMVLVAFLTESGAGRMFIDLALSLAGRWTGGPAKVAVVASGFMGTMMGGGAANVAATGSFTIPMMKRCGFSPHSAAAIESVASSGSQIMPPIMGMTAFLLAGFLGIPYFDVCVAVVLPVALFYISVFFMVHFEARKDGLVGLEKGDVPPVRPTIASSWPILLPIIVLFGLLSRGFGAGKAAFYAIVLLFGVSFLRKETRMKPTRVLVALEKGATMVTSLGAVIGSVGVLVGAFYVTGLGTRLAALIVTAANGELWIGLVICAIVCIILGMGLPTPIVYITVLMVAIPALIDMGANPLAAHLFCFYYGIISGITPPVCITAYVGAGIAGAPMMKTGLTAFKMGIAAYIVPFFFVFFPGLLLEGTPREAIVPFVSGVIAVTGLAGGVQGFFFRRMNWIERVLMIAGSVLLFSGGLPLKILGGVLVVGVALLQRRTTYREPLQPLIDRIAAAWPRIGRGS